MDYHQKNGKGIFLAFYTVEIWLSIHWIGNVSSVHLFFLGDRGVGGLWLILSKLLLYWSFYVITQQTLISK